MAAMGLAAVAEPAAEQRPARAIMWSTSNVFPSRNGYVTQTFSPSSLVDRLRPALDESEENMLAVVFVVEGELDLSQATQLKRYSTRNGAYNEIAPYIYAAADSDATMFSLLTAVPSMESATVMELPEVATAASNDKLPKSGAIIVQAGETTSEELDIVIGVVMTALEKGRSRYVAVVVEEPEGVAPSLESLFESAAGQALSHQVMTAGSRRLVDANITVNGTDPEEGDEWSIYYKGTYLYITPDLVAGILLFLLFIFVVLCGLSCLDSVEGSDVYVKKYPAIGKEY